MAGTNVGSVFMDMQIRGQRAFDRSIESSANQAQGKFTSAFASIAKMAVAAFSVKAVIDFGKTSVKVASETSGAFVGLNSILEGQGRSFQKAQGFIGDYIRDGLVPAQNAITAYKNLASRGYDDGQIQQTMKSLKDSAAFGRQSSYSYGEAIESATEGLRNENSMLVDNAGVTKNVARMWDEYAKSINTTANKLTQQQKIQAEVSGIMEESKFQFGDAAKYSDTYAGKIAKLSASFTNLKLAVGNVVIPIATKVLPYIQMAVDGFTTLANHIAVLFGNDPMKNLGSSVKKNIAGLGKSVQGVGDSFTEMGKKAKKAFGTLGGFDELNIITPQDDSGAGGGATGGMAQPEIIDIAREESLAGQLETAFTRAFDKIKVAVEPAKRAFSQLGVELKRLGGFAWAGLLDFYRLFLKPVGNWVLGEGIPRLVTALKEGLAKVQWEKINKPLSKLWDTLTSFTIKVGDGLLWLWENIFVPFGTWTMNEVAPKFIDILSAAIDVVNVTIDTLKPLGTWLWESFLQPLADWAGDTVTLALEGVANALTSVSEWIKENQTVVEVIAIVLSSIAAAWLLLNVAIGVFNVVGGIAAGVIAVLTSPITLVVAAIAAVIATIVLCVKYWEEIKEVAIKVWDAIVNFLSAAVDKVKGFFVGLWDGIKNLFSGIKTWFVNAFNSALEGVKNVWRGITGFFTGIWTGIKDVFGGVADWFKGIFSGAWEAVKKVFSAGGKVFDGIKDGILNGLKTVINGLIGGINKVISIPFDGINWALKKIKDISIAGFKPFSWVSTIDTPKIPKLATGGVVSQPTLAMVGEGKHSEAVIPLDNSPQMNDLINKIAASVGGGGSELMAVLIELTRTNNDYLARILDKDTSLRIGDRDIARAAKRGNTALGAMLTR